MDKSILVFLFILLIVLLIIIVISNKINEKIGGHIYSGRGSFHGGAYNGDVYIFDVMNNMFSLTDKFGRKNIVKRIHLHNTLDFMKMIAISHPDKNLVFVVKNTRIRGKPIPVNLKRWKVSSRKLAKKYKNITIIIAFDDSYVSDETWSNVKKHYIRGRDDHACFYVAKHYKKNYYNPIIVSRDKYRDFEMFKGVPKYQLITINYKSISSMKINPKPNYLGQMKDYKVIKELK